jgi:hypothetical protein
VHAQAWGLSWGPAMTDAVNLLERFGLITEEDLAALLGCSVKTLKNRSRSQLPAFVKAGRRRLFREESVRAYLEARTVPCFDAAPHVVVRRARQ